MFIPGDTPRVHVIGGPNGAGKSTTARLLMVDALENSTFVNADVVAQGLTGFTPAEADFEASRIMLERLHQLAQRRESFAFESTLAARSYGPWLAQLKSQGYQVHVTYVWVASPEIAVARVQARTLAGGHAIVEEVVRRRYVRSAHNLLATYVPLANSWEAYDNSLTDAGPSLIARQLPGGETEPLSDVLAACNACSIVSIWMIAPSSSD